MSDAVIGFVGVITGALLTPLVNAIGSWRHSKKDARYLAIRIVCILDKFIDDCCTVASDEGETDQSGLYYYSKLPSLFPFPEDIDWRSIDHKLTYAILNFPNKIDTSKAYISSSAEHIGAPYDDLAIERQYEFSVLGLLAADIAFNLRRKYALPDEEKNSYNPEWETLKFLREVKARIEKKRKAYMNSSV